MMTKDEAMQMALDALNNFDKGNHGMRWQVPVIKALRTALAQPELEQSYAARHAFWAVALGTNTKIANLAKAAIFEAETYTAPPQRKPLTSFERFNGVDIQFRASGTDWTKPYKVTVMSNKNEREDYRTTAFFDTLHEAIEFAHGIKD